MTHEILRTVTCQNQSILYTLEQKPVKNLNLRIRKDGSVYVSAHPSVPVQRIDAFVEQKSDYIFAAQKKFEQIAACTPAPKQYVSGESFYILGRSLRLQVEQAEKDEIFSDGVYLHLHVKDCNDFDRKKKIVTKYLDRQCREIFRKSIEGIYPIFRKYGVAFPKLRIRTMETRWGSCTVQKGIITLNKRLLEAPENCIEYVVMHEFCHFIHPNHSKHFYALLTMLMPDWKERKSALEKSAVYRL